MLEYVALVFDQVSKSKNKYIRNKVFFWNRENNLHLIFILLHCKLSVKVSFHGTRVSVWCKRASLSRVLLLFSSYNVMVTSDLEGKNMGGAAGGAYATVYNVPPGLPASWTTKSLSMVIISPWLSHFCLHSLVLFSSSLSSGLVYLRTLVSSNKLWMKKEVDKVSRFVYACHRSSLASSGQGLSTNEWYIKIYKYYILDLDLFFFVGSILLFGVC